jgi:hypothetical protein
MATLKHFLSNGEHNFLLESGVTKLGTPAGVWASYRPPRKNKPGEVMMLYATNESRHFVTHVLGALAIHSIKTYGELPIGSPNLSCHSIGIQRRLAGILGQIPANSVMNKENWFSSIEYNRFYSKEVKAVNWEDITYYIEEGKAFTLDVLKGVYV